MTDFTDKDEGPRYEHDCGQCTFLARHGKYDLYQHSDGISDFIFARIDYGESLIWRKPEVRVLLVGLKLSNWNLMEDYK